MPADPRRDGLTLDTTAMHDGTHALKLNVDDASGNSVTVYSTTITTDNAPENTVAPAVAAQPS